jgi:hypothetical protein
MLLDALLRSVRGRCVPQELDRSEQVLIAVGLATDRVIHLNEVAVQQHGSVQRLVLVYLFADGEVDLRGTHELAQDEVMAFGHQDIQPAQVGERPLLPVLVVQRKIGDCSAADRNREAELGSGPGCRLLQGR